MKKDSTPLRSESSQQIRERLLEIISEYQLHFQAMQGLGTKIVNPFSSLGEVLKKYVNPLSLFLNDVRRKIEEDQITYLEALEKVALFSRQTRFRDNVIAAVKELEQIEKDKPYFLYALLSLAEARGTDERAKILRERATRTYKNIQARLADGVLLQSLDQQLVALDAQTGRRIWSKELSGRSETIVDFRRGTKQILRHVWHHLTILDGRIYAIEGEPAPSWSYTHWPMGAIRAIHCLDLQTGESQWGWRWPRARLSQA